jgi:malate synthase
LPQYELISGIEVDQALKAFIECEALPGTGIEPADFWSGFSALLRDLTPENKRLLRRREDLQSMIDERNRGLGGLAPNQAEEEEYLREIGYLTDPPPPFAIGTEGVDPEIAELAGPQLVVPVNNARYALNAVNARWGSLYDALYGTDATGAPPPPGGYDAARGAQVVDWAWDFLDDVIPLERGSHRDVTDWLGGTDEEGWLLFELGDGSRTTLKDRDQLVGWKPDWSGLLFRNNGLHIEYQFHERGDMKSRAERLLKDVVLESALTAIMDCEDSVAAVDAEEKIAVYRNWLGLMKGDLSASFDKGGQMFERRAAADRDYEGRAGAFSLRGRALLFVRNVGHLMTNPMIRLDGEEAQEGLADAVITAMIALHDVNGPRANSPAGSIYIVKPKMHGPEEAAFANRLFDRAEDLLGLPRNSIKIGLMDEERRTSLNLAACIHSVRDRIAFINTGFLDRTGDEIHTSMALGPMIRKAEMKAAPWLKAYEDNNVDTGLACGFGGKAQIGKGMWAMPDLMADMLAQKIAHPQAGASTAWVPSPTAATLHAVHYHRVDVAARQRELAGRTPAKARDMLIIPIAEGRNWSEEEVCEELDNNLQSILGYVVRWIDQGVGCSKVPDLYDVGLMEDRATCRISSQHVANWLLHGVVTRDQVETALRRMAAIVDRQNAGDPAYRPMAPDPASSIAFGAVSALVFEGTRQPSGYTEPLLHSARLALKGEAAGSGGASASGRG